MAVEDVTVEAIERWMAGFGGSARSRNELLIQLHGILARAKRAYGLQINAAAALERLPQRSSGDIQVFSLPSHALSIPRARSLWPSARQRR